MANSTSTNPMYFDTTTLAAKTGPLHIQAIAWVSDDGTNLDIAADDDFKVTDTAGNKLCGKRAEAAGDDGFWHFPAIFKCDGLIVTTMEGGVCYVYLA